MANGLRGALRQLVERSSLRIAVAGDGDGNLEIADRQNYIYARLGGFEGEVAEVHTSAIRPNYDDVIYVIPQDPSSAALTWRSVFWGRDGTDVTLSAPVFGTALVRNTLSDSDGEILGDSDGETLEE